jgi:ankyrin repeat protein
VRDNKPLALTSLLDQGIPVNLTNSNGDTLLILAAYHEHEDMVRILIDAGADLNRLNDRGQTALVCAVFRDNEPIAQALLKAGADPHLGTQTPAQVAQFFDLPSMQKLLAN